MTTTLLNQVANPKLIMMLDKSTECPCFARQLAPVRPPKPLPITSHRNNPLNLPVYLSPQFFSIFTEALGQFGIKFDYSMVTELMCF